MDAKVTTKTRSPLRRLFWLTVNASILASIVWFFIWAANLKEANFREDQIHRLTLTYPDESPEQIEARYQVRLAEWKQKQEAEHAVRAAERQAREERREALFAECKRLIQAELNYAPTNFSVSGDPEFTEENGDKQLWVRVNFEVSPLGMSNILVAMKAACSQDAPDAEIQYWKMQFAL